MEICRVLYSTRMGQRTMLLPTADPQIAESIFGTQKDRIIAIEPMRGLTAQLNTLGMFEPSQKEVCDLFQALGQLFSLGVEPVGSLNLLIRRVKNIRLSKKLFDISQAIQQGEPIAEAFGIYKELFGETAIHLIRAGAATGNLGQAFMNLAENMTKAQTITRRVQGALIYPIAVSVIAYVVVIIMCWLVVPKLAEIYASVGGTLPPATQFVQKISQIIIAYPISTLTGPAILFIIYIYKEAVAKSDLFNLILRKTPGIQNFVWKKNLTQASSTLALLLESGLPLTDAIDFASRVVSDPKMSKIFQEILARIEDGDLVPQAFNEYVTELGPDGHRLVMAVEVGDATGSLAPLIGRLAANLEEEFEMAAENLNKLIEPAVIVVLSGVVGFLVYAIYYPIFTLGQTMMKHNK